MVGRAAYVCLRLRLRRDYGEPRILLVNSQTIYDVIEFWWAGRDSKLIRQRRITLLFFWDF